MFRHHPDGIIQIANLIYPLAEFVLDEPAYALPVGMIGREYVPGDHHFLYDGTSQHGGDLPWADGDTYLSKEATYTANRDARLTSKGYFAAGADTRGWPMSDYYEGMRRAIDDVQVDKRPTEFHDYSGTAWVENVTRANDTLCNLIDMQSSAALVKYPSPGSFREQEYRDAEDQARAFKAQGYPITSIPPMVQSWLDHNDKGITTAMAAADDIITTADFMHERLRTARDLRLKWKKAIKDAITVAAKTQAKDNGLAEIGTL